MSGAGLIWLLLGWGCTAPGPGPVGSAAGGEPPGEPLTWPDPQVPLAVLERAETPTVERARIAIDAGHGAPGNIGAVGCHCQREQDFTLRVADHLVQALRATGRYRLLSTRSGRERPGYRERLAAVEVWDADVLRSLHSDVRGAVLSGAGPCRTSRRDEGFSVLYSDDGEPSLVAARAALARRVSTRLSEAGLPAYHGRDYAGLYDADPAMAGAWIDRHLPGGRIFMLRRPAMASVIIETHHALHPAEVARWDDPATLDAFAAAVDVALVDVLTDPERPR